MFGRIEQKVRPLRLAFLVDPRSTDALREAIQINSTLWGGAYNPIIPLYKKSPPAWQDKPLRAPKAEVVIKGYVDAFDPDILIQCGAQLPPYLTTLGLEIVKSSEIWERHFQEKRAVAPKYGIGVFEVLEEVFNEHFRYKEKFPVRVIVPRIPSKLAPYWAALLGEFPKDVHETVFKQFRTALDLEEVDVTPGTLRALLHGNVLFPRRITQFDLETRGRSGFRKDDFLFFMDATRNLDIIDYWNLRALGKQVLPIPKQLVNDADLRSIATDFVNRAHWPYRDNPKIQNYASFIRSRHVTMEEMQAYATSLNIKKAENGDWPAYTLQHWYPRIWDEWGRDKDGADPADVIGDEQTVEVAETKGRVQFQTFLPEFAIRSGGYHEARCANEVNFRFYGTRETVAQILPKTNGQNVKRAISPAASFPDDWRVGRNGLVRLVKHHGWTEHWDVPLAQEVFFAWLKDLGWEPELSAPGLIAKEIFTQLEGFPRVFANEDLLKLLEHMNGGPINERELSVGEVKNRLARMSSRTGLHDYLISKNVFRIGAKVQCPSCRRNSWFSVDDLKDELFCPKCLKNFAAVGNIDQSTWCYKTAGPFSISGYADGAYCVLLSLDFIGERRLNRSLTSSFSFIAKGKGGPEIEADFGALWQEGMFGVITEGAIFGECKTFGEFEKQDIERMRKIAARFPGAVIAFCTLRKCLESGEIREITKIAKAGRKYWKSERPINPVLILTGNEILSMWGPPNCWEGMGLSKQFDRVYGLLDLCNATQQIYLKLPPWHQTWAKDGTENETGERKQ